MATARGIQVDSETGRVEIQNLTLHDTNLVEYLSGLDDEEMERAVERALRVGVSVLELGETSKDVEFVKREFDDLQAEFEAEIEQVEHELEERFGENGEVTRILEQHFGEDGKLQRHIEDAFGDDGKLSRRLEEEIGEDGEKFQKALDPDREGTPTHRLKTNLMEEIRELREKIVEEEAREQERQHSWKKGADFEETLGNMLDNHVYGTQDSYEHTGDKEGDLPGRDVGDYVLTVGETGQRIVLEAKSKENQTQPGIKEEMAEAIENRDADYGIFVSECESFVPDKVGYFQEWDRQILAISLSADQDDELEPGFLDIGLSWAKARLLQEYVDSGSSLDLR